MKRTYFVSLVLVFIFFFSSFSTRENHRCEQVWGGTAVTQAKSLPEIDLLKKYPKKEVNLQDIAEVTYIPFEMDDNGLLSAGRLTLLHWQGDTIVTFREKTIHLFHRSGKFLNSFNHFGGGTGEYQHVQGLAVDFHAKEIFVYDYLLYYRILVYSFDGEYKRTLPLPAHLAPCNLFDYDRDFLFCEDGFNMIDPDRILNKTPYSLISKKTGEVTPLPLSVTERIGNRFCVVEGQKEILFSLQIESVMKADSEIIIADNSVDTVYSLRNRVLRPFAIRKNRTSKDGYPVLSGVEAISDKYMLWGSQERNIDVKSRWVPDGRMLLFNRENGEIREIQLVNSDFVSLSDMKTVRWYPSRYAAVIPENCIIHPLAADELMELYEKGRLKGRLKEIASKLEEEDNPVLTLIRFKE